MELEYYLASKSDLPFIIETYNKNIAALHGENRSFKQWEEIFLNPDTKYYIVKKEVPVAWFRLEIENDIMWLGMLQVSPEYQRQGIGKYIISLVESLATDCKIKTVGIHTTEDNLPARGLYESAGYLLTEIGKCTNADGKERIGYTFEKNIGE